MVQDKLVQNLPVGELGPQATRLQPLLKRMGKKLSLDLYSFLIKMSLFGNSTFQNLYFVFSLIYEA